jgi:hypothetical protein
MLDPKIKKLDHKILMGRSKQIPIEQCVQQGQLCRLTRSFLQLETSQNMPVGTPVLVLKVGGYDDQQFYDDKLDVLMPDGTIEYLFVKFIVPVVDGDLNDSDYFFSAREAC